MWLYTDSSRTFSMTVFLSWSKILSFFLRKKDFIRQSPDKKGAQPTYVEGIQMAPIH